MFWNAVYVGQCFNESAHWVVSVVGMSLCKWAAISSASSRLGWISCPSSTASEEGLPNTNCWHHTRTEGNNRDCLPFLFWSEDLNAKLSGCSTGHFSLRISVGNISSSFKKLELLGVSKRLPCRLGCRRPSQSELVACLKNGLTWNEDHILPGHSDGPHLQTHRV